MSVINTCITEKEWKEFVDVVTKVVFRHADQNFIETVSRALDEDGDVFNHYKVSDVNSNPK